MVEEIWLMGCAVGGRCAGLNKASWAEKEMFVRATSIIESRIETGDEPTSPPGLGEQDAGGTGADECVSALCACVPCACAAAREFQRNKYLGDADWATVWR